MCLNGSFWIKSVDIVNNLEAQIDKTQQLWSLLVSCDGRRLFQDVCLLPCVNKIFLCASLLMGIAKRLSA